MEKDGRGEEERGEEGRKGEERREERRGNGKRGENRREDERGEEGRRDLLVSLDVSELHQVKWHCHGYTPEMCWQMDTMCFTHPKADDSFSAPSLTHTFSLAVRNIA